MTGRILLLILFFLSPSIYAQKADPQKSALNSPVSSSQSSDELLLHLTAAEKHQISGNLTDAAVENRTVLGIALERLGNIEIEEGRYKNAVRILTESLKYDDNASRRTNLAIAYLRQNQFEEALVQAQTAVSIDPKHVGAHYILGNIYYTKEDYKAALPELEKVFSEAPDFELGRALGLTYLNLRQIERAREHFKKMQVFAGKDSVNLHVLFATFYQRTDYPLDAERELKHVLALQPNKPKVNFYLGYLLLQHGGSQRLIEAGTFFQNELKLNSGDFYSLFFSGVVASSLNDHQKAILFLQNAVKINPNNSEAYLFLGQSQIETNDLTNAEKNLRRAVELETNGGKNTQSRRTHFMLGRLLLRTGKKEEGQKELAIAGKLQQASLDSSRNNLDRILGQVLENSELRPEPEKTITSNVEIKLPPERASQLKKLNTFLVDVIAQAFNNLGVIAAQNERLADSIEEFEAAASWKPDFPGLDRNWGILAFRAGQFEKAIGPLARQLKAKPQDELVRQMLGTSYYFTKNYLQAAETLDPIEASLTGNPELAYFYGIALVQSARNSEAVQIFNRLAAASQNEPEALSYAAQGFMLLGDYGRAVKEFRTVGSAAPTLAKTHFFLGQSLIRLNRLDEAEKAFREAIRLDPADESSKYHLAFALIERKTNLNEAIKLLGSAIQIRPGFAEAHYQLGKIYLERKETEKAIQHLESASRADNRKDYIFYQLSIAYRRASRISEAELALKTYRELKAASRRSETPAPMGRRTNVPK